MSTLAERFWCRVDKRPDGCWLWTGSTTMGYGQISTSKKNGPELAHRVSWLLAHGFIPTHLHVLHRCDVRACVNPDHLFLGTQADNIRDMIAKGRQRNWDRTRVKTPLPPHIIDRIGTVSDRTLAREAGVSHLLIARRRREFGREPWGAPFGAGRSRGER
jgi:hypothetical protein